MAVKDTDLGPVPNPIMSDSASADLPTAALRELHAVGRWSKTPTLVEQQLMLASKNQRLNKQTSDSASADLPTAARRELHAVGRWSKTPTLVEQQLMLASKIYA